jgi:redox-sensitive bicupin YhaK (pirin superfamily)
VGSHRGFETVTYMIDGVFRHQDSNDGGGLITDGGGLITDGTPSG